MRVLVHLTRGVSSRWAVLMPCTGLSVICGKKPGFVDGMKKSMGGKDAKLAMLNAEHLLAMDPQNGGYAAGVLRNATKGKFLETCRWIAPIGLEALRRDKKPNKARFATFMTSGLRL